MSILKYLKVCLLYTLLALSCKEPFYPVMYFQVEQLSNESKYSQILQVNNNSTFVDFYIKRINGTIFLNWEVNEKAGVTHYLVRMSTDRVNFYNVKMVLSDGKAGRKFYKTNVEL